MEEVLIPLFGNISVALEPVLNDRLSVDCDALEVLENAAVALGKTVFQRIDLAKRTGGDLLKYWRRVEHKFDRLLSNLKRNPCIRVDIQETLPGILDEPAGSNKRGREPAAGDGASAMKMRIGAALASAQVALEI